jgi:hypothetical protein
MARPSEVSLTIQALVTQLRTRSLNLWRINFGPPAVATQPLQ